MSNKININKVAEAAKAIALPGAQITKLLAMLADMQEPKEEKPPAVRKQFVVLVSDPMGIMPKDDLVAWVLQIPDNESVATVQDRIHRTAYDFNATKKGRQLPVQTVGEAIENIKAGMFKEADVWVKTRTPVLVVKTSNEIPNTPGLFGDDERGTFNKDAA